MYQVRFQNTIEHVAHASGRGYWSGRANSLTFLPAPAGTGVVFRRVDLPCRPTVAAHVALRRETQLRTTLEQAGTHVEMVEHVMAALYGLNIDNCIVECDAPEMPAMDGSSLAFAMALESAGLQRQLAAIPTVTIDRTIRLGDENQWILAFPAQDPSYTVRYELDYGPTSSIPVCDTTQVVERETFSQSIAPARTFLEEHEAQMLQSKGVASHVTYRDLLVFGKDGPIDNELRFTDECSRHKLLDVVGDLALCGYRIHGNVIAHRSGHRLNGELAQTLYEMGASQNSSATFSRNTALPTEKQVARNAA